MTQHIVTLPSTETHEEAIVIACCTSVEAAEAARRLLLGELAAPTPEEDTVPTDPITA